LIKNPGFGPQSEHHYNNKDYNTLITLVNNLKKSSFILKELDGLEVSSHLSADLQTSDQLNLQKENNGMPCWKAMSTRGPRKCPCMDISNNVHLCTHFEMSTRVDVVGVHGWTFLRSTRGHRVMSPEWTPKKLKPILKKK
jgi:hypothetical protein